MSPIVTQNPYYAKLFLKRYIDKLEHFDHPDHEVLEEFYELYPTVMGAQELAPTDSDIVCYQVSNECEVWIKEYPKLISGQGTTGLRTWEAALYFAAYLNNVNNNDICLANKTICELGTGTGLLLVSLVKNSETLGNIKEVIFTDGDSQLIENLNGTFELNSVKQHQQNSNSDQPIINCHQLLWGTTNEQDKEQFLQPVPSGVDYVIAADVTYDTTILRPLCSTILDFFASGTTMALIAATVRNEKTLHEWELELTKWFGKDRWNVRERVAKPEELQDQTLWFRKGTAEIRIYEIRK